jgi:pentatricopeptide repeat protein
MSPHRRYTAYAPLASNGCCVCGKVQERCTEHDHPCHGDGRRAIPWIRRRACSGLVALSTNSKSLTLSRRIMLLLSTQTSLPRTLFLPRSRRFLSFKLVFLFWMAKSLSTALVDVYACFSSCSFSSRRSRPVAFCRRGMTPHSSLPSSLQDPSLNILQIISNSTFSPGNTSRRVYRSSRVRNDTGIPSRRNYSTAIPPSQEDAISLVQDLQRRYNRKNIDSVDPLPTGIEIGLTQDECNEALGLCVATDAWDCVLDVLDLMDQYGHGQIRSTYETSLRSCAQCSNAQAAVEILSAMRQAGYAPAVADVALVIDIMCQAAAQQRTRDSGRLGSRTSEMHGWPSALRLLRSHEKESQLSFPIESYDAILRAIRMDDPQSSWTEAVRILQTLEQRQVSSENQETTGMTSSQQRLYPSPQFSTYRVVIECCVKAHQAEQAERILQSMIRRGVIPTTDLFEQVIGSLSRRSQWRRMVSLLDVLDDLRMVVPPSLKIYNTILAACAKAKEVVVAKNILLRMKKHFKPNVMSYNSVMAACASTSRWQDALAILDQCHREPGVNPDIYTYTNAIRACAKGTMKIMCSPVMYNPHSRRVILLAPGFFSGVRWQYAACAQSFPGGERQALTSGRVLLYCSDGGCFESKIVASGTRAY